MNETCSIIFPEGKVVSLLTGTINYNIEYIQ